MNRLTLGDKVGYGFAAAGDTITYILINTYLVFFLTTVAGIDPAAAGSLALAGSVWNAFFNPVIGYISDHTSTKWGRRRPFMAGFSVPLFFGIIGLFFVPDISYTGRIIYYGFCILIYWTGYTGFFVPYYALGAQYTTQYEERTALRSFASFFNTLGTTLSMALPVTIVGFFEQFGITTSRSWTITASLIAAAGILCIFATVFAAKDKDPSCSCGQDRQRLRLRSMFRDYAEVLALKPVRLLLCCSVFYLIAFAIFAANLIYFLTYNMAFEETEISLILLFRALICIAVIIPAAKLCALTDRRTAILIIAIIGCSGCVMIRFLSAGPFITTLLVLIFTVLVTTSYWQIVPSMFYDLCDYDEYKTGKRREGSILAIQGLVESISSGIGTQILGIILHFAGFNGSSPAQSPVAMEWILNCMSWVPILFMGIAIIALIKYPITRKYYNKMTGN